MFFSTNKKKKALKQNCVFNLKFHFSSDEENFIFYFNVIRLREDL